MGSTKNCIYRATKRHLNIFDISSSLVVAPIWKWVHLFGPGSKIVLFANFHQFQIRIFTFDLIFGPETFVLPIFWRVTAQIRIERATQICFNFLDSSTGLVLTPHESWVPFLFPDRVSICNSLGICMYCSITSSSNHNNPVFFDIKRYQYLK